MSTEGYEYLGELGRGGFSTVYRAHDERHDRMVAIKILNQAGDVDDDTRRRFDRECRAMGKVGNHPHIASIHDSGFDSSKRPFIVMEFYERGALADQLVGGQPLPLANVLKMGVQISSALEVAHQREILHQDVKPENIFISEYHDFALGDFGISAFVNTMRTQQHAFTAAYAAPESMESPQSAGPRADLYSLGGTIYTTLTGSAPFAGSSLAAIMAAVMTKEPPPIVRADVPRSLARLVMQLLSKKPQDRPSSAREVARQLRQIEVDLGLPSTPMKIQQVDTQPVVPTPIAPSYPPQPDDRGARDAREASAPTEDENRTAAVKKVPIIKIEDVRPNVSPPHTTRDGAGPPAQPLHPHYQAPKRDALTSAETRKASQPKDTSLADPDVPSVQHSGPTQETSEPPPAETDNGWLTGPRLVALATVVGIAIAAFAFAFGDTGDMGGPDEEAEDEVPSVSLVPPPPAPEDLAFDAEPNGQVLLTWTYGGPGGTFFDIVDTASGDPLATNIGQNEYLFPANQAPAFGDCVIVVAVVDDEGVGQLVENSDEACR